jgi:hypothetical protein
MRHCIVNLSASCRYFHVCTEESKKYVNNDGVFGTFLIAHSWNAQHFFFLKAIEKANICLNDHNFKPKIR